MATVDYELLLEAERRGLLSEEKQGLLVEAKRRGLVGEKPDADGDKTTEQMRELATARKAEIDKPEPDAVDYLVNRAKRGIAGFGGIYGDLHNLTRRIEKPSGAGKGLHALGYAVGQLPQIFATSEQYRDVLGEDPEMTTRRDWLRYLGGIAEMGAAGGPIGMTRSKAAQALAAKGLETSAGQLSLRAGQLATTSVGAGLGMEAGGDIASSLGYDRNTGEAIGAVAGGIVPTVTGTGIEAGINLAKRKFSPAAARARVETGVTREVLGTLDDPAIRNIERSVELSEKAPGFAPSLPARSGSPALLALEKQLTARSPKALNTAARSLEENEKAIRSFVDTALPKGGPNVINQVKTLQNQSLRHLEGLYKAVDDKLDDLVARFEANPNIANGERLREIAFKQKIAYKAIDTRNYNEVYAAAVKAGVRENIDDVVSFADDVLKKDLYAYQQSEIPSVFRQLKNEFLKETPEGPIVKTSPTGKTIKLYGAEKTTETDVSFEKLHSLYKNVNRDLAALRGSVVPDKNTKIALLERVKSMLSGKLDKYEDLGWGDVAEKFTAANKFHAEEYAKRFKQGIGLDIVSKDATGAWRVDPNKLTELVTTPNNAAVARQFKQIFQDINPAVAREYKNLYGEVPEAWKALTDGYLDRMFRQPSMIDKDGKISVRAAANFLRQHQPTLAELPEVRQTLTALVNDNSALVARRAEITAAQKALQQNELFKMFNGQDPQKVLANAMGSEKAMTLLAAHARGTPAKAQAFARAVADEVLSKPDSLAFFVANESAIRAGLKPLGAEHFSNVKAAMEMLAINRRHSLPANIRLESIAPDKIAEGLGSSPRALIAHYINVARGRTGVSQEAAAFFGRWFDKLQRGHKETVLENLFYDKDVAGIMASLAKSPQPTEKLKIDFAKKMIGLGVQSEVAYQGGQPAEKPKIGIPLE